MKKTLLLLCASVMYVASMGQSADEILQKYVDAAGGTANAGKVKTMKLTASVSVQGMEFPMTQQIISGRGVRTDVDVMSTSVTMSYKDGKGWKVNQFAGAPDPTPMDAGELADHEEQISVVSPLFDSKKNGETLSLAGEETVNGVKTWKLKAVTKSGREFFYYVSSVNYDLVKLVGKRSMNGSDVEVETVYEDYRNVEGLRLPFSITNSTGGATYQAVKVDKYEINVPVDEKSFDMPAK